MKTLATLAALACVTAVQAQSFFFTATLSGAAERPSPNASPATGFATVTLNLNLPHDLTDDTISYAVSYSGFTGNTTAAHIHGPASSAVAAGVLLPLPVVAGNTFGNFSGSNVALTPLQAAALENALLTQTAGESLAYVNIHSTAFPGGEVRGQLVQVAVVPEVESTALVAGALGLGALLYRRRRTA